MKLLRAIEYSTNTNKRYIWGLYDVKDNGTVIMYSDNLKDISKRLNCSYEGLISGRCRGQFIRRRFELVRFKQEEEQNE